MRNSVVWHDDVACRTAMIGGRQRRSTERLLERLDRGLLADPQRLRSGARQYAEMCAGCHLAPKRTEIVEASIRELRSCAALTTSRRKRNSGW